MEQLRGPIEHLGFQMLHAGMQYVDEEEGPNQNFVVGTFATASAAGLIYVGSGGKSTHRLAKLLHFDTLFENRCTPELITIAFRQAVSALTKRPDHHFPMKEEELKSRFQLVLAHRVFFRKGVNVTTEFFNNAKAFSLDVGEIEGMSNQEDLETLRARINAWVKKHTRGQITEALPPLALVDHQEALTHMFMISVTSLRASWQTPFTRDDIHPATFHNLNGTEAIINFITCPAVHLPYYEDPKRNLKYVEIPYTNNEASMCLCMPFDVKKASMADMVKNFKYGELKSIGWQKRLRKVDLKMPIFEVEHVFNLKDFFERIGVEDPKEDDLSHMVNAPLHSFRLTGAYHKCTFGINEHGTCAEFFDKKKPSENPERHEEEGSSDKPRQRSNSFQVKPLRRKLRSGVPEPVQFHANRPFIFCIRHNASGVLLFCGRVVDLTPLPEEQTARAPPSQSDNRVIVEGRTTVEDRSEAKTLYQRTRDWLANEQGFIGRKRTQTM